MRRIIIVSLAAAAAALALWGGTAAASGPAAPGKDIIQATCGTNTFTIAVPRGEDAVGAAQIVGQKGHGIPVTFEFSIVDVTTNTLLFTGSNAVGHGHSHPNQPTTSCTVVFFEGTAADFFGSEPLPPGVAPTDIIRASLTVALILKL
jgi:hypothetical protein